MREFYSYIFKVKRWMCTLVRFTRKYNLLALLLLIKLNLLCPYSYIFDKTLLSAEAERLAQLRVENKGVLLAKSFVLYIGARGKSLI